MTRSFLRPDRLLAVVVALLLACMLLPARASGQSVTTATAAPAPVVSAIQSVIQQANQEQQQALAQDNPSLMQDTATSDYYAQLAQTNRDLKASGVTGIELLGIDWGAIQLVPPGRAKAITAETWRTSFGDGTIVESTDPNVYSLVQQAGSWKIAADVHPGSAVQIPAPSTVPSGQPLPPGQHSSLNWSGYEATGGSFSGVSGTWTVPRPNADAPGADAAWVGIGGVITRDLIQAGTEATVSVPGQVSYDAWIETLPRPSRPVNLPVHPGDSVSVSISQQGVDQWLISMKNNTTGQAFQDTIAYHSSGSSAEWVEEAPSSRGGILPLDSFGTLAFTGGATVKDGKQVTMAQAGAQPITMIGPAGQAMATPSPLGPDGGSFTVSRSTASPGSSLVTMPVGPVVPIWPPFPFDPSGWPGGGWTSPDGSVSVIINAGP